MPTSAPATMPDTKPAAILVPRPFLPNGRSPHHVFKALFAQQFGTRRVHSAVQGDQFFIAPGPGASLHFPTLHPLHPEERYDWFVIQEDRNGTPLASPRYVESWRDEPGTIKFGFPRDEDSVDQPGAPAKASFAQATNAHVMEYQTNVRRMSELILKKGQGATDAAEDEELDALQSYFRKMASEGPPDPTGRPRVAAAGR